jgi:hypothetical protein
MLQFNNYIFSTEKEVTQFWLDCILISMVNHCEDPSILIVACNAICKLSDHHPNMLTLVGDDDHGSIPLHTAIMYALDLHPDNAEVSLATCKTIGCIAVHSSAIQQVI